MTKGAETPYSFDMRRPTLVDVISAAQRSLNLDLSVCFPASVTEVIDGGARVKVAPDIKPVLATDTGEQILEPFEITNLPVLTYGQGTPGGGYMQFPVQIGDKGLVIVNDRSLGAWYEGGLQAPPDGYHTHSAADGIFLPGLRHRSIALSQDNTAAVLEHPQVKLGANAVQSAARTGDQVNVATNMGIWIAAVTTALAGFGITIPAPTDFGIIGPGSSKVKIE